jgi:hypothetical protein
MLWNRRSALLLPLLALVPAGCVQQPAITIHHAEVRGVSPMGVSLAIFLQVRNDNAYDVQVRSVRCNVTFGRSATLGPIDFSPNQWLPANQATLIQVPVSLPWTLVPALASESSGAYAIPYHITGVADVTASRTLGIDRNNYPINEGGFIPRQTLVDGARSMLPIPF